MPRRTLDDEINEARAAQGLPPVPTVRERRKQKHPHGKRKKPHKLKLVPPPGVTMADIQEMQQQLEELKSEVEQLREQVTQQQAQIDRLKRAIKRRSQSAARPAPR